MRFLFDSRPLALFWASSPWWEPTADKWHQPVLRLRAGRYVWSWAKGWHQI